MEIMIGAIELGFIYAIMSLGVYISFRVLNIPDLTIDGSFTLGCCVSAVLCMYQHPYLALIFAFIFGGLSGIITGILQTKLKIQPILSGILTMTALYSINLKIMDGRPNLSLSQYKTVFTDLVDSNNQILFIGSLIILITIVLYLFLKTSLGLALRATGDNEIMVKTSSINTDRMKMMGLAIANALVALSGGVLAQYQQFADVSGGIGIMVIGLASIIIGEAFIRQRNLGISLFSVLFGSVIYRGLLTIVLLTWLSASDLKLFSAILVIIAISLPKLRERVMKGVKKHA